MNYYKGLCIVVINIYSAIYTANNHFTNENPDFEDNHSLLALFLSHTYPVFGFLTRGQTS